MSSVATFSKRMEAAPDQVRDELMEKVRPLMLRAGLRAVGNNILMAVYDRAGKRTAGGIIIPETHVEDTYQGKIGLVVDIGPMCSVEHAESYEDWFGGNPPKIGDWVGISIRNAGLNLILGDVTCRLVCWDKIDFTVQSPYEAS